MKETEQIQKKRPTFNLSAPVSSKSKKKGSKKHMSCNKIWLALVFVFFFSQYMNFSYV